MNVIKIFAKNPNELETFIQTVTIYSKYIVIEFGIEKCTIFIIKKGKEKKKLKD